MVIVSENDTFKNANDNKKIKKNQSEISGECQKF